METEPTTPAEELAAIELEKIANADLKLKPCEAHRLPQFGSKVKPYATAIWEAANRAWQWGLAFPLTVCQRSFRQFLVGDRFDIHGQLEGHAGLAAARAEGRIGGRRKKLDDTRRREIAEAVMSGRKTAAQMARMFGVSPPTVSRVIAAHVVAQT
jgi:hypothetical protein